MEQQITMEITMQLQAIIQHLQFTDPQQFLPKWPAAILCAKSFGIILWHRGLAPSLPWTQRGLTFTASPGPHPRPGSLSSLQMVLSGSSSDLSKAAVSKGSGLAPFSLHTPALGYQTRTHTRF